jgi:perosamine synthetase
MNPYGKFIGNELEYVQKYLENPHWDTVFALESQFSRQIGGKYSIAVNSGTSSLHSSLVACGVHGAEVLIPALAPAMVAFAIIHAGGKPVFCDVDLDTHHIALSEVERKITPKTAVILGVSLHGLPINWKPFRKIAQSHTVYLIDDCAQALGAKGIGSADITCFSFEDKKHITTGSEGGMIMTDNADLAEKARKFAGLGYKHMTADAGRTSLAAETYQNPDYERFDTIGLNYRMSRIQAAIGLAQLEQLDHIVARRRAVANLFSRVVYDKYAGWQPWHSYYTWVGNFPGINWKQFYQAFKANGGDGFYAMPQVPYKEPALRKMFPDVSCPVAEDLQRRLMLFKTNYRDLGEAERQAEILCLTLGGCNELRGNAAE